MSTEERYRFLLGATENFIQQIEKATIHILILGQEGRESFSQLKKTVKKFKSSN